MENFDYVKFNADNILKDIRSSGNDVILLAVSKTFPVQAIIAAAQIGIRLFGESKVQEAQEKIAQIGRADLSWHLIGHLQSNKANKAAGLFNCIQSVDSVEIAAKLDSALKQTGRKLDVLVELKVSGEENKFGLLPDDLPELLDGLGIFKSLNIKGMMAMAPYFKDAGQARPYFRKAREAFLKAKKKDYGPNISMEVLSMGMSHDYKQAIEEGSTMVRIGSAIFGKREY